MDGLDFLSYLFDSGFQQEQKRQHFANENYENDATGSLFDVNFFGLMDQAPSCNLLDQIISHDRFEPETDKILAAFDDSLWNCVDLLPRNDLESSNENDAILTLDNNGCYTPPEVVCTSTSSTSNDNNIIEDELVSSVQSEDESTSSPSPVAFSSPVKKVTFAPLPSERLKINPFSRKREREETTTQLVVKVAAPLFVMPAEYIKFDKIIEYSSGSESSSSSSSSSLEDDKEDINVCHATPPQPLTEIASFHASQDGPRFCSAQEFMDNTEPAENNLPKKTEKKRLLEMGPRVFGGKALFVGHSSLSRATNLAFSNFEEILPGQVLCKFEGQFYSPNNFHEIKSDSVSISIRKETYISAKVPSLIDGTNLIGLFRNPVYASVDEFLEPNAHIEFYDFGVRNSYKYRDVYGNIHYSSDRAYIIASTTIRRGDPIIINPNHLYTKTTEEEN